MKDNIWVYIGISTVLLVILTIMCNIEVAYSWIFYVFLLGQASLILMVYKILKDKYTTSKTFEDFYEDRPISKDQSLR